MECLGKSVPPTEIFLDWPLGPEVPEEEEGKLASSLGISGVRGRAEEQEEIGGCKSFSGGGGGRGDFGGMVGGYKFGTFPLLLPTMYEAISTGEEVEEESCRLGESEFPSPLDPLSPPPSC